MLKLVIEGAVPVQANAEEAKKLAHNHSGAKPGATEALPPTTGLLLSALGWGGMTPLLVWLALVLSKKG